MLYTGDCAYRYLLEPNPDITCNPWSTSSVLKVQCRASYPTSLGVTTEIRWFFNGNRINDTMPSSFPPLQAIVVDPNTIDGSKTIISSTLILQGGTDDSIYNGNYYCRILINDLYYTNRSGIMALATQDNYISGQPCQIEGLQSGIANRCAGDPRVTPTTMEEMSVSMSTIEMSVTSDDIDTVLTASTTSNMTEDTTPSPTVTGTGDNTQGSPLQVWVYVLVAVAAVFGMIIVVLTILCVGLCLKKNKTEDGTYKRKLLSCNNVLSNANFPGNNILWPL